MVPENMKKWEAPELIVLIRRKSEESVLLVCKNFDVSGEVSTYRSCVEEGYCGICEGFHNT